MSTVGESLQKDNKITNAYRSRGPFPIAFVCTCMRKKIEVIEFRVLYYYPLVCVHARESTGGPNYFSLIIQPHLFEDPSSRVHRKIIHRAATLHTEVMTTPVCIPYPGLIKGHSVCYKITFHMQELGILNHVVCSWSQASECHELNTVNATFESIILALFFSYDWIMNVSGIIKVGMDWKSALFSKCML